MINLYNDLHIFSIHDDKYSTAIFELELET